MENLSDNVVQFFKIFSFLVVLCIVFNKTILYPKSLYYLVVMYFKFQYIYISYLDQYYITV